VSDRDLIDGIVRRVVEVLGSARAQIPLHEPTFAGNEWQYVKECLDTGWVSSVGSYVDRLETDLADYTGARRAVVVVNGTAALYIGLKVLGVKQGDEVLVPSLSFVATANAVAHCGAVPHFVDSEASTLGIDVPLLNEYLTRVARVRDGECINSATGARIAALIPMHTFGHPVDLDALLQLGERFRIPVLEDAAESLGSLYKGRHTGTFGALGALSFNGNKIVTTGGGGALITDDEALAKRAKHLTTTARLSHRWSFIHDEVGYNFRMPNLNAALGCAQLEQLPGFIERKRQLAVRYADAFKAISGARIFIEPSFARSNYWLNALLLDRADARLRDQLLTDLNAAGVLARPAWNLLHTLPMFAASPRMQLSGAIDLTNRIVNLPSSASLPS
jgi:perosamine synthetase